MQTKEQFYAEALSKGHSLKQVAELWKESGNALRRNKGGRAAFYDYLRNGGSARNEAELIHYIHSAECQFSENERKSSNYGHWLAIAELVESVRG